MPQTQAKPVSQISQAKAPALEQRTTADAHDALFGNASQNTLTASSVLSAPKSLQELKHGIEQYMLAKHIVKTKQHQKR
jgi:hypothetical protein